MLEPDGQRASRAGSRVLAGVSQILGSFLTAFFRNGLTKTSNTSQNPRTSNSALAELGRGHLEENKRTRALPRVLGDRLLNRVQSSSVGNAPFCRAVQGKAQTVVTRLLHCRRDARASRCPQVSHRPGCPDHGSSLRIRHPATLLPCEFLTGQTKGLTSDAGDQYDARQESDFERVLTLRG
jgi:hypothetical protein